MFLASVLAGIVALSSPEPSATPGASPQPDATPIASPVPTATATALRIIGVTTAERKPTPLSATAQTTYVVDRAKIETNGYQTIADAIRDVPGMTFFQYGAFGAQVHYGALGSDQSIILLDGLPITDGSSGSVDLGTLSSNDVERIEVVESGGSTLYGSGGAGGVINIITAVPRSTYLMASYGSFGDRAIRMTTGNGTIGVSFERHIASNDYPYVAQNGLPAGVRDNAQALQSDGSIDYEQNLGSYEIRATARFSALDLGLPGPVLSGQLTPLEFDPSNRNDLSAKISRIDGKFSTSLHLSGFRQALSDNGSDGSGPQNAIIDARTNVALEEIVAQSERDSLVAGIDLSRETALDVLGPFGPPPEFAAAQSQSAVYAQQSIGIGPAGKVYAGLRAENDTPAGGTLEPAAGFLLPLGPLHIAGNAASSFIVPTLFDLYYPNFSNPNLLPERDRNVNIVISSDQTFLHPKLTIFDRTADNLITSTATTVINAGRAHFQGAVLSIAPRLFSQLTTEFSVTDLPTATQVSNDVAARVGYEPILQGTLSVEHPIAKGRFGYGVTARFAGAHTESFAPPGTFGQYSVFNAYARVRLSSKAVLTGRVNDIGNVYYGMFYAYPVPARSYRLELSTR